MNIRLSEKEARKQAAEIKRLFKAIATRGDQTALEDLFYQFSGRIRAYARTLLLEKDMAEDVTTEVFMKIAYLDESSRIDNPVGWMFKVTKNLSNDFNRRVKFMDDIDTSLAANNKKNSQDSDFEKELELLPNLQKEIILLEVVGKMAQRDIADHLKISRAQVRREREEGLAKLETLFNKQKSED